MKRKHIRLAVDAAMCLCLLFLMGYHLWGERAHEWAGAGMFLLFIAHHILNFAWWKRLLRGKYSPLRALITAVDLLTLCAMLGLMISGVILSREVFAFLPISGGASFARSLHMVSSFWGFALMSAHLGLHWGTFLALGRRAAGIERPSSARKIALNALGAGLAVYGLSAFLRRDILDYMLLRSHFVFFDFGESPLLCYADHLAMMALFIFLAHCAGKAARRCSARAGKEKENV